MPAGWMTGVGMAACNAEVLIRRRVHRNHAGFSVQPYHRDYRHYTHFALKEFGIGRDRMM